MDDNLNTNEVSDNVSEYDTNETNIYHAEDESLAEEAIVSNTADEAKKDNYISSEQLKLAKTLSVISLILAIISLLSGIAYVLLPCAIGSIVAAIFSLKYNPSKKGLAIAGMVISGVAIILLILFYVLEPQFVKLFNSILNKIGYSFK